MAYYLSKDKAKNAAREDRVKSVMKQMTMEGGQEHGSSPIAAGRCAEAPADSESMAN